MSRLNANKATAARKALIWAAVAVAILAPLGAAATSPLLAWRGPIYIAACFAGVAALGLMLLQPLLMSGALPGPSAPAQRRAHRWVGGALALLAALHVAGLWITSPPDVIDALLFRSPTPFSPFGVIAMWALFAAALLAAFRRRARLSPRGWRTVHLTLAAIVVCGTVAHALLIEGTMEPVTKIALCAAVLIATAWLLRSR